MIDKYRLDDLRLESGEKGDLARWVIQLQTEIDSERRKVSNSPVNQGKCNQAPVKQPSSNAENPHACGALIAKKCHKKI